MSEVKKLVGNTLAQGAGKAVSLGLSLLATALLTRYLGTEGYGRYVFITALVLLSAGVSDWGTSIIGVREAVAQRGRKGEVLGGLVLMRLAFASGVWLVVNLLAWGVPGWREMARMISLGSVVLLVLSLKTSAEMVFHSRLVLGWKAVMEVTATVVFLVCAFGVVKGGGSLMGVIGGWVGATAVAAGVGWGVIMKMGGVRWRWDREVAGLVLKEALPTGALLLLFSVYNRVDVLILEHFKGEAAVGVYGLAYKVHENLVLGAAFLMNAAFPGLTERFARGEWRELLLRYKRLFVVLLISGVGVAVGILVLAPVVVGILAGGEFLTAVLPLRILMAATVFSYLNHLTGYSLIAVGRQRMSLVIAVGALFLNVGLNWWLIPGYSYIAAAAVTGATEGMVLLLSSLVIFRVLWRKG